MGRPNGHHEPRAPMKIIPSARLPRGADFFRGEGFAKSREGTFETRDPISPERSSIIFGEEAISNERSPTFAGRSPTFVGEDGTFADGLATSDGRDRSFFGEEGTFAEQSVTSRGRIRVFLAGGHIRRCPSRAAPRRQHSAGWPLVGRSCQLARDALPFRRFTLSSRLFSMSSCSPELPSSRPAASRSSGPQIPGPTSHGGGVMRALI